MKKISYFGWLVWLLAGTSCDEQGSIQFPQSSFDAPFPKRHRDLRTVLGDQLTLRRGDDTLSLKIGATAQANVITDTRTGDTLFYGKVSQFRGLYYFSQAVNDTAYWIYAVRITDRLIYGLGAYWQQGLLLDQAIEEGKYPRMVQRIDSVKHEIWLRPRKRDMKDAFTDIIAQLTPDTILTAAISQPAIVNVNLAVEADPEAHEFLSKAYPNPARDYLTLELQQTYNLAYLLTSASGQTVQQGRLNQRVSTLDVRQLAAGVYILDIFPK